MKKKFLYIVFAIALSLGLSVFAQTIFNIDEAFFTQTGILSGNNSPLHFNFGGNDFDGIMFLWDGLNQTWDLTMNEVTINCNKKINWLYLNTARWNRLRPLDADTLVILSGNNNFVGYWDIEITWWFFTECNGVWIENDWIYGYIKHTYEWEEYEMWAWIDYSLPLWNPIWTWSGSLKYISGENKTAAWHLYDKNGWIAKVYSNMELYGNAEFTGNEVEYIDPIFVSTWNQVTVRIFSNKNAQYEITWDVIWIFTWLLNAGIYNDIPVQLINTIDEKDLTVTISTGAELVIKNLSLVIEDNIVPTVNLISPINGVTINGNEVVLTWTWNDNIWIDHYSIYVNGAGATYSWNNNIWNNQYLWPILNGNYTWYVVATDYGANTSQSTMWTFIISGDVLWPTLVSPLPWANVNIWTVNLVWNSLPNATSWYTRQISTNNTFSNVVSSGSTNNTGVSITHNPSFMTGTFYWRVIDKKTAGVSEHRVVIISDIINLSTKVNQFNLNTITGANLSQSYSSNIIWITWLTNNVSVLARLENNIWALFVNNIMVWSQYLVKNNDQIRIELISSNIYYTWVSAKLIVWTWNSLMSGTFAVITKTGNQNMPWPNYNSWSLPYSLKMQAILFVDSIAEMYKHNPQKLSQFLTTFKAILQDRSDVLANSILQSNNQTEKSMLYLQKDSIDYLYFVVNDYLNNIDYAQSNTYIAPNGKSYLVQFDDNRFAYTSPDFTYRKYFPTWELFKRHIDINNPGSYYDWVSGDTITAPNGKTYTIHTENSKRTSNDMMYKKYFDTRDKIIEHISINNPSATRNHKLDTNFVIVQVISPNGKKYSIFKTSADGENANKYSSFGFVTPKYFNSLQSAKDHIMKNNG